MSVYSSFFKKFNRYLFSPFELVFTFTCLVTLIWLIQENLELSRIRTFEKIARNNYDKIKQAVYLNMSSPLPTTRYLMKNIEGPGPLPPPLQSVFLDEGVVLNYMIRVYEPAIVGRPKDQLRFEVSHEGSENIYRYTEVHGLLLEQVIAKDF